MNIVTNDNNCCISVDQPTFPPCNCPPGPQGLPGAGTSGWNGINAFTTTTASFIVPAILSNVQISVVTTAWIAVGQILFIQDAGFYSVVSIDSALLVTVKNIGALGNAIPTTVINGTRQVSPAGAVGPTGVISSITLTVPADETVTGSPLIANGTLAITRNSQNQNLVLASPNGAPGIPSYRALVPGDIPSLDFSKITTGTVPILQGGTGQTTKQAALNALSTLTTKGDLLVFNGTNNTRIGVGSNGQVLAANSAAATGLNWMTVTGQILAYGVVSNTQISGTAGGTQTLGSLNQRVLNTVDSSSGFTAFSLAGNLLSLDAGTYWVIAEVPCYSCSSHQLAIVRSDGTIFYGSTAVALTGSQTESRFEGVIQITAGQTLTMKSQSSATQATTGQGYPGSFGNVEVFGRMTLIRIA